MDIVEATVFIREELRLFQRKHEKVLRDIQDKENNNVYITIDMVAEAGEYFSVYQELYKILIKLSE